MNNQQYQFQQKDQQFIQNDYSQLHNQNNHTKNKYNHNQKVTGKIISKIQRKDQTYNFKNNQLNHQSNSINNLSNYTKYNSPSRVHHGININYSQLFNHIKIPQYQTSAEFQNRLKNVQQIKSIQPIQNQQNLMALQNYDNNNLKNNQKLLNNQNYQYYEYHDKKYENQEKSNQNEIYNKYAKASSSIQLSSKGLLNRQILKLKKELKKNEQNQQQNQVLAQKHQKNQNIIKNANSVFNINRKRIIQLQKIQQRQFNNNKNNNLIVHFQQNNDKELKDDQHQHLFQESQQYLSKPTNKNIQQRDLPRSSQSKRILNQNHQNQHQNNKHENTQKQQKIVQKQEYKQAQNHSLLKNQHQQNKATINQLVQQLQGNFNHQQNYQDHSQKLQQKNQQIQQKQFQFQKEVSSKQEQINQNQIQSISIDQIKSFNLQQYTKIYPILKNMQSALKAQIIDAQSLVRSIKKYLQVIAVGYLDNIDEFDLQPHKKKIVKTALLYERIAIIVIAFSYANHSLTQSHKYLLNLLSYALSNSLMLVKVLQGTQIINPLISGSRQTNNQIIKKSDRLLLKKSIDSIRNNNDVLIDSIYKLSKYDNLFFENLKQMVKALHKSSLTQTFYNVLEYFAFFLCVSDLYQMLPFLAVTPDPYLPACLTHRYTLVIDIVQVCCQGTRKAKFHTFRPYAQHFLAQMNNYFEIVAFTNSLPNQIDKLINLLDPKGYIKHRLYKHHGIHKIGSWVKDLQRLGRPMNRVILLDNQNLSSQSRQNMIHIPQWRGTRNDTILAEMCPVMAMIAIKQIDAKQACNKIREQTHKNEKQGVKYVNFGISFQ